GEKIHTTAAGAPQEAPKAPTEEKA
ncbi:hypothetical protein A0J61_05936, partial [Choanephora cucurbitarum]